MTIFLKRAYEPAMRADGCRILVERLWPRGVSKATARIDLWVKEAAPSSELRRWFNHRPDRWPQFKRRYFRELADWRASLDPILERARAGRVTFVFASRELRFNNAVALKEFLERVPATGLSASMTVSEFDHGYWYATDLKAFAKRLGIPAASGLRKDELEQAITHVLATGRVKATRRAPRRLPMAHARDVARGLRLALPVVVYTNDADTKAFLEREAHRLAPGYKRKSGARYRLNRWREQQLAKGVALTYGDIVKEYVRLSQTEGPFQPVPHGRYINFVSEFFAAEPDATQAKISRAWKKLKTLDMPKTYSAWAGRRR